MALPALLETNVRVRDVVITPKHNLNNQPEPEPDRSVSQRGTLSSSRHRCTAIFSAKEEV